jgi:biopolymer transport protein ExbB
VKLRSFRTCDKQQGSVANAIKSALIKYQAVKKKVSIVKKQRLFKEISKLHHLKCQCYKRNMTISSLVSLGTLID